MHFTQLLLIAILAPFSSAFPSSTEPVDGVSLNQHNVLKVKRNPASYVELERRKGGGGGGKGGGGSGGGGKTGGGSSGGGGAKGGSSGIRPSYSGGRYYGGGATSAYRAGGASPSGLRPLGLLPLVAIPFFVGAWFYPWPVYAYPYHNSYTYYNSTERRNDTKPVVCLCQQYADCGCDDNSDSGFINTIVNNGTALNTTLVQSAVVNGTDSLIINGTLPNGTATSGAMSLQNGNPLASSLGCMAFIGTIALFLL